MIRFDRPDVDYQQILYAALNQALQARPSAGFDVVAVSPTRGTAASVQMAQTSAQPPCPGSDALDDRHGRARHAPGRGLHHRSGRDASAKCASSCADPCKSCDKAPPFQRGFFVAPSCVALHTSHCTMTRPAGACPCE